MELEFDRDVIQGYEVLADGTDLHNQVRNVKVTGTDGASLLGELLED